MAVVQVATAIVALTAARRLQDTAQRIERDLQPIVQNMQSVAADAARAANLAAAQVERVDRMLSDLSQRAEQIMGFVPAIFGGAGKGAAFVHGLKTVLSFFQQRRRGSAPRNRPSTADEDDALFIG